MNTYKGLFRFAVLITIMVIPIVMVHARPSKKSKAASVVPFRPISQISRLLTTEHYNLNYVKKNVLLKEMQVQPKQKIQLNEVALSKLFLNIDPKKNLSARKNLLVSEDTFGILKNQHAMSILNRIKIPKCEQNTTVGVSYRLLNLGLTHWKDNYYASIALGPSAPDASVSYAKGMCEPSTGFFVNATIATIATMGKGFSATRYANDKPSVGKIISTPTIGVSVGVTFKVWSNGF